MTFIAHYDLKLHQMNVKIVFLNEDLDEIIYMVQLENFEFRDTKHLVYRFNKFIYDLK